jgi:hypothetical protein
VSGTKDQGVLGEADLNLAETSMDHDFKYLKLTLKKCQDENAFIEVGMKAADAANDLQKSRSGAKLTKTPTGHTSEDPMASMETIL